MIPPPQFSPLHHTAQTDHGRAPKFCMVGRLHNNLITAEAIFDISPLSRARGVGLGPPQVQKSEGPPPSLAQG